MRGLYHIIMIRNIKNAIKIPFIWPNRIPATTLYKKSPKLYDLCDDVQVRYFTYLANMKHYIRDEIKNKDK